MARPASAAAGSARAALRAVRPMAVAVAVALVALAGPLHAQDPDTIPPRRPPGDSARLRPLPPDTLGIPRDVASVLQDTTPQDTAPPAPDRLPGFPEVGEADPARGVWEWDRPALERLPDLSLLHLLERLPGVVPVRADLVNQAEGAVVFGAAAGAIRWVVDGYELDPLTGPGFDPSRLPLLALDRVRVERRITGATVRIETLSPDRPEPRSIIEAATGDFATEVFRGMFLAPRVLGGPLALGFERLSSNGASPGTSNHTAGWVKWSWVRESSGLQLEYRQSGMERLSDGVPFDGLRRDWWVRGRTARGPLTAEAYVGASRVEDEYGEVVLREGTPHMGVRLGADLEAPVPVVARTALRFRDHPRRPRAELELGLRTEPVPFVALEGETVLERWAEGPDAGRSTVRAVTGPLLGLRAFAEATAGGAVTGDGVSVRVPDPAGAELRLDRSGLRAGVSAGWGKLSLTGAWLRTELDSTTALGLPGEAGFPRLPGGEATGFEVLATLPTGWAPLRVQGWYVGMDAPPDWLYLPAHNWRAGLVYHHLPLPSGNVEIFARVQHVFRGRMNVPYRPEDGADEPGATPDPGAPLLTEVAAFRSTNLELSIRVLTVRAFLRWSNIMNRRGLQDLPGFTHPGQHVLYGVKWEFVN